MVRVKTGQAGQIQDQAGQGQAHGRLGLYTRADSGWGWQSRLGLDAEQGSYGRTRINAGQALDKSKAGLYRGKVRVVQDMTG